jgi:tetratricopeptide (TPR) repeat protein
MFCLLLALVTAFLYAPVLRFDFVGYDDPLYIINNSHVSHGLSWGDIGWSFHSAYAGDWRPLAWMSHMLDCQLYGLNAGGHHATNVVLHIFNSVILFLLLQTLTGAFWRSALVAALFAWHPLNVESIAWVANRKNVLGTFFWLSAIWFYVSYARRRPTIENPAGKSSGARVSYCVALLSFAFASMANPVLITLPLVLLLLDGWPLGRLDCPAGTAPGHENVGKRFLLLLFEKVPFFVVAIASGLVTILTAHSDSIASTDEHWPLSARIVNALASIARYLAKTVWPRDLGAILPFISGWPKWKIAVTAAGLLVATATALYCRRTRPYWLTGWLWFAVTLASVLGLFALGANSMADHYTYIPSIGLFLIAAWSVFDIAGRWRYHQWFLGAAAAGIVGACLVASHYQLEFWRNTETLFSRIARSGTNERGHAEYASFLMKSNHLDQAQAQAEQAVNIAPRHAPTRVLLGQILLLEGKPQLAVAELKQALQLEPKLTDARMPLGEAFLSQRLPKAAAAEFAAVIQSQSNNFNAHFQLGQTDMVMGKLDDASLQFNDALRLSPQFPQAHFSLGLLSAQRNDVPEAITHYQDALRIYPDYREALNNLAWILASAAPKYRDGPKAVQLAERACQLTGHSDPAMVGTLAAAYAQAGRFDDAIATAKEAHDKALARGQKDVATRNLQLLQLYSAHQTVH